MPNQLIDILEWEPLLRSGAFFGVLALIHLCESLWPKRTLETPKGWRWFSNFGLMICATVLLRLLFPFAAVGIAQYTALHEWGILAQTSLPYWLQVIVGYVLLDFIIYWQHRLFHAAPLLWRLHKVHHTDLDLDSSSGVRFHPAEIVLSMLIKIIFIVSIGIPVLAVLIFEIVLNSSALFSHANLRLPSKLDAGLRLLFVTPDMHRVHHSVIPQETNSNFSFNLSCWDRFFRTYRSQPAAGHVSMRIGLSEYRNAAGLKLLKLLLLPFKDRSASEAART